MKLEVEKLRTALKKVGSVIVKNPVLPICESVRIQVDSDSVTVSATNARDSIISLFNQEEKNKKQTVCIEYFLLSQYLGMVSQDTIIIEVEKVNDFVMIAKIKKGLEISEMMAYDPADFLEIEASDKEDFQIKVDGSLLSYIIRCQLPFVSDDQLRPALTCIKMKFSKGNIQMLSADNFVIMKGNRKQDTDIDKELLIPPTIKLLNPFLIDENEYLLEFSGSKLICKCGDDIIILNTIDEIFPDVLPFFEKFTDHEYVSVDTKELIRELGKAKLFIDADEKSLKINVVNQTLNIRTIDEKRNKKFESYIDVDNPSETDLNTKINIEYLINILKKVDHENVHLGFDPNGDHSAAFMVQSESFHSLIMPIR